MALEGQLSDFNLAEILQLLASQQKSGFLNLETNRNMVFIFDKGVLISTRDRRSRSRDPLESFLRAYGFFNEQQWKHVDYVRKNSSLDLTEILVSEGLMTRQEMDRTLKSLAQEPERRYPSVDALVDDIQRHRDGLPVRARKDTWSYRTGKFLRHLGLLRLGFLNAQDIRGFPGKPGQEALFPDGPYPVHVP